MPGRTWGSLGVVPVAVLGVAALGVAPVLAPAVAAEVRAVTAAAKLLDAETIGIVIGGSGDPIPSDEYVTDVSERYINPAAYPDFSDGKPLFDGQPTFDVVPGDEHALFTPEGLYPFEGVKELELNPSVAQGLTILNTKIGDVIAAGHDAHVLGYSQSAIIASEEMQKLLQTSDAPSHDQLSFSLIGDIDNPNGGIFPRFAFPGMEHLSIPSLGITFGDATPADTPWDTAIYTLEYDGFADFPRYPIDLLSDINAVAGIAFIHGTYPTLTASEIADAIPLSTSADYTGELANTHYYLLPTENLPMLDLVRDIPLIGTPIADLVQPDLKILVDLGYGNVDSVKDIQDGSAAGGWDTGPANVSTPFGLFPDINLGHLFNSLVAGTETGFTDFFNSFKDIGSGLSAGASPLSGLIDSLTGGGAGLAASSFSLTDIVNDFSAALSHAYAALLPTTDIINALVTTLPAYDIELITHFAEAGNLLDAIGMPFAVNDAIGSVAGGFEIRVIENALTGIIQSFDPDFSLSL